MEFKFFKEFLMISHPTTVVLLVIFLLILWGIHHLDQKGISFGKLVTIGTISGAFLGVLIQIIAGFPDAPTKVVYIKEATKWYSLVGGGFIDLIRMLVVPLVLISIIHVILHMNEGTNLKKLVGAMLATNLGMVSLAAIVGLSLGYFFGLGAGGSALAEGTSKMREVKPVVDTFRALIPMNPVKAMADTNVIAVVIFGVVIGGIAQLIKKTGTNSMETFTKLFDELHILMGWACDFIIGLMPYGVVALLANTLATRGLKAIMDMGLFIVLLYVGLAIMFVLESVLLVSFGVNPVTYFRKAKSPLVLAFTSRSSMGVLPLTVETLTKRLGVSTTTANTVASFGATAGMQGCAGVFPGFVVVYIANVSGVPFDLTLFIMSIVVIALGSIGIAGVPGTATMAASVSLSGTGLGAYFSSISPVLAIDPIIDMGRTMLNVSGAMTNAIVVDRIMGTFDEKTFQDMSK
ncbi:MAG: cation:dicarboxylase symporter family transporter [Acidaminococcus sp.]|jgi:L-cystine uptake protein TcyP (sodium:dicarboxylate symporter family)|nr:cation:dicarboxylase symporter family transporter [Acidaminococcus sp.]MCI2100048.1 cation:dicarboxylase symporter family transporter [Acidaminococcus sp.]MCI2114354.1 cation:dicarboxylase symporter family transporter [Acidaminococcus sp.]MCI2116259.1 cation:dicarboxylase symporter family transporter [Acidaminococcus sp.]